VATAADTDELVVSATRRETSIQDVPYNISAVSGQELQARRITNLNDFARQVPGLTLTDQGGRDSDLLTVRGLNTSNIDAPEIFLGNSGGDTVATYVGEIPVYVDLKLIDIERVEVLIGPQGTLYGAGTLAGAVRYIPKRPQLDETTLELHGSLYEMSESSDLGTSGDAVFNIPLIRDKLAFRGLVGYENVPGYIDYNRVITPGLAGEVNPDDPDSVTPFRDANDSDAVFARAGLLWQISDTVDANLTYYYQKIDSGGRSADSRITLGLDEYEYGRRFLEPKERENHVASLEINWDLGFAELTSATGYTEYSDEEQRDQTDLLLDLPYSYDTFPFFAAFTSDAVLKEKSITQEFRLVSNNEGPLNWIAGAFYRDFENKNISQEFTPGFPEFIFPPEDLPLPNGDLEYDSRTEQTVEEIALYGEITVDATKDWQFTWGARWFEYEDDTRNQTFFPLVDIFQPFPDADPIKEDDVILKFNTSYAYDDFIGSDGTFYLTISEGYRNGRSNGLNDCIPGEEQNVCATEDEQRVDADTTINYEVGAKTEWLDGAVILNGSLFLVDWDDIRVTTITATGLQPIDTNGSKAQSKGIELSGNWQVDDNWSFSGSYAYTSAELTEDAPGLIGGRFGAVDGQDGDRLPGTPENQLSLYMNYSSVTNTGVTIDAVYGFTTISDVLTKVGGRNGGESLPGFTVHNASIGVSQDNWTATLFADNLFDKYAATGVRRDRDYIGVSPNGVTLRSYYQNIIQPRTVGLDVRYRFDF
jgi:outer membrane receptor protein involved in Fe transport